MGLALFASLGLPGLSGFVGEFLIFNGVFGLVPWSAAVSVIGLLLTAVFLLRLIRKVFHGPLAAGPGEMARPNDRRTLAVRPGHRPDRHSRLVAAGAPSIHQWRHAPLARTSPPDPMTPAWTILSAFAGALLVLLLPARMAGVVAGHRAGGFARRRGGRRRRLPGAPERSGRGRSGRSTGRGFPVWASASILRPTGLSLTLLLLTGIVAVAGVLFSWNVERRPRAFFAFFMTIIGGVYGVFLSRDAFLLFVCYEIVILPKYMLIAIWGSTNKEYGAMKLTMYSIGSSALILIGLVVAYAAAGGTSFDHQPSGGAHYSPALQAWAFPVLFLGFAVLAGIWPFHTWAPTGHVAAPTAASMLLAGVVMKLGAYGALCVAMPLFPQGFEQWKPVIAGLAVIGMVYGALTALAQKDLKFVIGYSSVSHMGFVLLGLAAGTHWGLRGAVLQMISHGIIAGLLFGIAGRVVYERTHTRDLTALQGFDLVAHPARGGGRLHAGHRGLDGAAGIQRIRGGNLGGDRALADVPVAGARGRARHHHHRRVFIAGPAQGVFPGEESRPMPRRPRCRRSPGRKFPPSSLLIAVSLAIGIYPKPWVVLIDEGLRSPLFQSILSLP